MWPQPSAADKFPAPIPLKMARGQEDERLRVRVYDQRQTMSLKVEGGPG